MILYRRLSRNESNITTDSTHLMLKTVTSYSIFLLAILLLSLFMYSSAGHNLRLRFQQTNRDMLRSSVLLMDKNLDIMEVFCRQILQDKDFRRLSTASGPDTPTFFLEGYSARKEQATNLYPELFLPIEEYYVHFPTSQYILSPSHFTERSLFYQGTKNYPTVLFNEWVDYLENEENYETLLNMDKFATVPGHHYYMYTIGLQHLGARTANASVSFIIEAQKMGELFSSLDLYNTGYLIMTDNTGRILFSISGRESANGDAYALASLDTRSIRDLEYNDDIAYININGSRMIVTKQISSSSQFYYYLIQPESAILQTFRPYQFLFLIFLLFALLIGGSLVVYFSRRNVRPIVALGQELQEAVDTSNQLQEVVDKQRPIICNSYVRQLMLGTVSSENELAYIIDYLALKGDNLSYNVLYGVAYDNENENNRDSSIDDENILSAVLEGMHQILGEPLLRYCPSNRTIALLLVCDGMDEDRFIMKTQETVLRLHEYLLDQYSIWFFAGMGHNTDSLMNIWEAFQQAQEAVNYATKNYIFLPYEIIRKDSNVFYYPPELSTKLIHFITVGNQPQVLELFNLIHHENIEERSLPIHLLKYLLSDIRNTLLKARFELPADTDAAVLETLDSHFDEHLTFKLCEDLALTLCTMFQAKQEDTSLAATIEKYILDNYRDPSLCLNKISDEFQISESYFSHMFKEKTGINFSTYLENVRMKEASRLVRETDTNLSELYLVVGYNNVTTFRRAFKKCFGITPSEMRATR